MWEWGRAKSFDDGCRLHPSHTFPICLTLDLRRILSVLIKAVSSFQRLFCTHLCVAGPTDSVLIREVPFILNVLNREVPLYHYNYYHYGDTQLLHVHQQVYILHGVCQLLPIVFSGYFHC